MKMLAGFVLLALLAVGAPAKNKDITVKTDKFTGKTVVVMERIGIGHFADRVQENVAGVSLSLAAVASDTGEILVITSTAKNWQFLSGADVHVLADGVRIDLGHFVSARGRIDTTFSVGTVEDIAGAIKPADLHAMASAKELYIEVGMYQCIVKAKNIVHLREFEDVVATNKTALLK